MSPQRRLKRSQALPQRSHTARYHLVFVALCGMTCGHLCRVAFDGTGSEAGHVPVARKGGHGDALHGELKQLRGALCRPGARRNSRVHPRGTGGSRGALHGNLQATLQAKS